MSQANDEQRCWREVGIQGLPGWDPMISGRWPGGQLKRVPAVAIPSPAAQGVSIYTRVFHALATPGFSTPLLATLPSSTDTHMPPSPSV